MARWVCFLQSTLASSSAQVVYNADSDGSLPEALEGLLDAANFPSPGVLLFNTQQPWKGLVLQEHLRNHGLSRQVFIFREEDHYKT